MTPIELTFIVVITTFFIILFCKGYETYGIPDKKYNIVKYKPEKDKELISYYRQHPEKRHELEEDLQKIVYREE